MVEVWVVTLLLIAFFVGATWIWMRVWIIDIFKAINNSRNSNIVENNGPLFASCILLVVIIVFIK